MPRDEELFADAATLPATERSAFIDRVCAGDAALRARLEALLAAHAEAERALPSPLVARGIMTPDEKPGDRIGRYKLLQQIGEGGCGVVWMAEQEEPVRRRVALKVIKLGMDTKAVIARFEAERQALAMMDHPNIAKVLDAGATESGRPFFVMELVRGIPITRFCDDHNLPPPERLRLFIQVCHAVQHAHQKGIIHRDLKPSNVLVTRHDDVAVPIVIDFGIAKATQGRLVDQTVFTAFEQFIGTPAYMSPEQAEFNALDVDTRSDLYSLGVLLYELLAGRPPFDPKALADAGLDHLRQIIRETDPPRPSTRVRTLSGDERTTVARLRGVAPAQLPSLLSGDLDWIVMKALEKDRTRRYATASAFAADIEHHLASRPFAARPPTARYRLGKFVARHRVGVAATGLVIVSLAVGLVAATRFYLRELAARQLAAGARDSAERLMMYLFTDLGGDLNERGDATAVRRLAAQVRDYYDRLPPELRTRETTAARAMVLAGIHTAGPIMGDRAPRAGSDAKTLRGQIEQAAASMAQLRATGPMTPFLRIAAASVLWAQAGQLQRDRDYLRVIALLTEAEDVLAPARTDAKLGEWAERLTTQVVAQRAMTSSLPAVRTADALTQMEQALARAANPETSPSLTRPTLVLADLRCRFGALVWSLGDPERREEARRSLAAGRAQLRGLLAREPFLPGVRRALGLAAQDSAKFAWNAWRFDAGREGLDEAQAQFQEVNAVTDLAISWADDMGAGRFFHDWLIRDFAAAERDLRKGIELLERAEQDVGPSWMLVTTRLNLAQLQSALDRDDEASRQLASVAEARKRVFASQARLNGAEIRRYVALEDWKRSKVELQRLDWPALRANAEQTLARLANGYFAGIANFTPIAELVREPARRNLVLATFAQGDYAAARRALDDWKPCTPGLPGGAELQDRFERIGDALTRIHVLARTGDAAGARTELAAIWDEMEAVFAAGPEYVFNQVQTARALLIRSEVDTAAAPARRAWLERAAGPLRQAAAAGRLTRFERETILAPIERQLAALGAPGMR